MRQFLSGLKTIVLVPVATVISLVVLFFLTLAGCPSAGPPRSICDPVHEPEKRPEKPRPATPEAKPGQPTEPPTVCDCIHEPPPERRQPPAP